MHPTNKTAPGAINIGGHCTDTNGLNSATAERQGKAFSSLAARFALRGHTLHRCDPKDGVVVYYSERWGLVRYLPTLADAERFLIQLRGGND